MRIQRYAVFFLLAVLVLAGCAHGTAPAPQTTLRETANPTPLDQYIAKPDPNYSYQVINTIKHGDTVTYIIEMTSQAWRSPSEVDQPVWKHWLTIVVPKHVDYPTALMVIGGGGNRGEPPKDAGPAVRHIAEATRSVAAEIRMVPNQPLTFSDDNRRRSEDSIIAYCWDKFLRTGDAEWLTRLPMTKSVVRAMDTVQSFCAGPEVGKRKIESFVVTGASKRGWTTWTTAAVDARVIALAPMVIDLLNLLPSFEHHWAVYGRWAPAINDYVSMDIMDWLGSAEFDAMLKVVEPYSYRDRLTMPKLLINSAGDQFFLPDSWQFYLNDLKGQTYLRYVPNTGHGLSPDVAKTLQAFYECILTGAAIPQYRWSFPDARTIRVETPAKPSSVKLWQATNPEARDFRIDTLGQAYQATELTDQGNGVYVGQVPMPDKGWTAFLVELTFPGPSDAPFVFTSPVRIVPDTTPFTYERPKEYPKGFLSK